MSKFYNTDLKNLWSKYSGASDNFRYLLSYGLNFNGDKELVSYEKEDIAQKKFTYPITKEKANSKISKETIQAYNDAFLTQIFSHSGQFLAIELAQKSAYISGLGSASVTETGIDLHGTFGVPYLKGSAIKGMVKAWCLEAGIGDVTLYFGTDEKTEESYAGQVIFHDVLFSDVTICEDIMTPHKEDTDGRLTNVNPIKFLTVRFHQSTNLLISTVLGSNLSAEDLNQVGKWVIGAFEEYGLGAKTAIGYGRFSGRMDAAQQAKIQTQLAKHQQTVQEKAAKRQKLLEQQQAAAEEAELARQNAIRLASLSPEERQTIEALELIKEAQTNQHLEDTVIKQEGFIDEHHANKVVITALYEFYQAKGYLNKPSKKMKDRVAKLKKLYTNFQD